MLRIGSYGSQSIGLKQLYRTAELGRHLHEKIRSFGNAWEAKTRILDHGSGSSKHITSRHATSQSIFVFLW